MERWTLLDILAFLLLLSLLLPSLPNRRLFKEYEICYTDAGHWKIFDHPFVEGDPFSEADFQSGIPVIFGPKYQKFMEAVQLLEAKGAYSIKDYDELKTLLDRFLTDEVFLRETGTNAGYYVTSNAGATEKIMHMINF